MAVGPFRIRPYVRNGAETGKWFVDAPASFTDNGKRKRRLFDNVDRALSAAKTLQSAVDQAKDGGPPPVDAEDPSRTFSDAADGWLADEQLRVATMKKRAATLENDGFRLRAARRFFGKSPLMSIDERRLTQYQAARLKAGPCLPNAKDIKTRP